MSISARLISAAALVAFLLISAPAAAQTHVQGTVVDATDEAPLPGVNVLATLLEGDSTSTGVATDNAGRFTLPLRPGPYRLRFSFIGYVPLERTIDVRESRIDLGRIELSPDVLMLGETVVEATQDRVVLRGDTAVFNADAFSVNPDASAEDLVRKLPGVVVQDGQVQAQGEEVRRVLVDGEEFFTNDPTAALRNLPSEIIQEIEVFDRQSDQAQFTGFDDDDTEKTINIVTRPGMRTGQFGRVFGGYGTDERYAGGAAINIFDGSRRISLIGLTNNVNQQNFASEDLLGVLGDGGRGGGGRGMRGGNFRGGRGGMGGNARDYMVGEQPGLNNTNSLGINYNDRWGDGVRVNASYFFNRTGNTTDARLDREYLVGTNEDQFYSETNQAERTNANHRLNARIEADLTDATQLIITPRLSLQSSTSESASFGATMLDGQNLLSRFNNQSLADNLGYSAASTFLLRHRFATRGRTISARVGIDADGNRGDTEQSVSHISYVEDLIGQDEDAYDREVDRDGSGRGISANVSYTEPIGESGSIQLQYAPSLSTSVDDQAGFRRDPASGGFTIIDSLYTSQSERSTMVQRGGLSYRWRSERVRLSAGLDVQNEWLEYDQGGPRPFAVERSYFSVLPSANINLSITEQSNLSLFYRSSTSTPNVRQLRDLIDDSNPLFISSGNPDLRPSTSHRFNLRFRSTRPESGTSLMGFASVSTTRDHVGNAVVMAGRDSVRVGDVVLEPGAQYSYPVNVDGYWNARSFVSIGGPVGFLSSNVNLTGGASYTHSPTLMNGVAGSTDAFQMNGRIFIGSNISERVDFSASYGLTYSRSNSTMRALADNRSYQHRGTIGANLLPWRGLVLESNVNASHYTGISAGVDPTTVRWNAAIGYKFLQGNRAEVRLGVMDILNQNTSIRRNVTDLFIEDSQTQALGRYFMLNLTYRVRHFGGR